MQERTCTVDGCPRPLRSSGAEYCNTHYFRVRRTGSAGDAEIWDKVKPVCVADGCDRRNFSYGYCSLHYQRVRKHGDPSVVASHPSGSANPAWKNHDITYFTAHQRVTDRRGRAADYLCRHCGEQAKQWAYDHLDPDQMTSPSGTYSAKPQHYVPLCVSCHRRFDIDYAAESNESETNSVGF